jgi:hypothetical protein
MSQYYVLVRINIVREPFIQHSDIIPRTYPPEHSPLFDSNPRPRSPDSPISPSMSPPIFPRQPIFPRNDINFMIVGIFTSRARAVNYFSRQDRLHLDRYRIFGPFRLNHGTNDNINRNEQDPNFYIN